MSRAPALSILCILHSDNGREFINKVIHQLLDRWHSNIQLVSGRPRHPQSQGVVERAHGTLERKLAAEIVKHKEKSPPWSRWLSRIICKFHRSLMGANTVYFSLLFIDSMNTQVHETTGSTPYELVFGQKPREVVFLPGKSSGVIMEEDLEADGFILSRERIQTKTVVVIRYKIDHHYLLEFIYSEHM